MTTTHLNLKQFTDAQLRELHLTTVVDSGDEDFDSLAREICAEIVEEAHERALSTKIRYVTIYCTREGWSDNQRHVGDLTNFMADFGLTCAAMPGMDQGCASGIGSCGHKVEIEWEVG